MKRAVVAAVALLGGAVLITGGYFAGRQASRSGSTSAAAAPAASTADGRKVLYWHDPMVPGQRFDKPGKSPFMDMQLVPVYAAADSAATGGGVKIDPAVQQNLGVRVARVRKADVSSSFDAVGTVQFDERLSVAVQTRVAGYIERLAVRAPMERVRKGQALATVFAPDWLGPQNELLALERAGVSSDLIAAARDRLRALSIPESLVRQSEALGTAQARFTIAAPVGGIVAELGVREGVAITPGMTLFRIAGLDKVWAVAEVPEAQALRLARGQKVKAVLQAEPGVGFAGELAEILPQVSAGTRTLQARFEVDNKGGKLTPGLLLRLQVAGPTTSRLVVPSDAVIRTGQRTVVLLRREGGGFESREVVLGQEAGDETEVAQGLREGEQVVVSGQFLVDSEASLRSATGRFGAAPAAAASAAAPSGPMAASMAAPMQAPMAAAPAPDVYTGEGKVESVDADGITISHGAIAALKWPPMTMGFGKPSAKAFADVRPGDTVRFEFRKGGATGYVLVSVQRAGAAR